MPSLILPTPEWQATRIADGRVVIEQPLLLRLAEVRLPDGAPFKESDLGSAGFFTYRSMGPGADTIWDAQQQAWRPDPGAALDGLPPAALIAKPGDLFPWQAPLVALGQKSADGQDRFVPAVGAPGAEYPRYYVRCYFQTASASGLSAPSAPIRFLAAGDSALVGLSTEQQPPEQAEVLQIYLRSVGLQPIGQIELRRVGAAARISIARIDASGQPSAHVTLHEDGSILVRCPGAVTVQADRLTVQAAVLETERVLYQPNAGGAKQYL